MIIHLTENAAKRGTEDVGSVSVIRGNDIGNHTKNDDERSCEETCDTAPKDERPHGLRPTLQEGA